MKFNSVFILLSLLLLPKLVMAKETIVWGIVSFPPGYITEGPEKGNGYGDLLDKFMREKLPQYNHKIIEYPNWERQLEVMRRGPLVCTSIMWYRPPEERDQLKGSYLISAPDGVFFQHDVVVHKDKRHLFGETVSFQELLHNKDFTFGYNRPYGITFNRIITEYINLNSDIELDAIPPIKRLNALRKASNISVRTGGDMIEGTLEMVLRKRIDYTLEYAFMINFMQKQMGFADDLVSIPVKEVEGQISRGAFACSDTAQGERAISAINNVLKEHRASEEYKKATSYLVPKGREEQYWKAYEEILHIYE